MNNLIIINDEESNNNNYKVGGGLKQRKYIFDSYIKSEYEIVKFVWEETKSC